jgi:chromosome segregation ATPase
LNKNNDLNINEEKNNIQLSGKVSATMKAFIENMPEGTFAEKIRSLIDSYSVTTQEKSKLKIERIKNLDENLEIIKTNLRAIEQECNLYVNQIEDTTKEKIEEVVKMAMEQEAVKVELEEKNKEFDKLLSNKEDLEKELDKSKTNIDKLNEEVKLLQDTKLDLTNMNTQLNAQNVDLVSRENAALKEIERLKEVHSIEIAKLKEQLLNTQDELKSTVADAKANKVLLESKLENEKKSNEDLKVQIDEIKQEKRDIQKSKELLEIDLKDLNTKLQEIEKVNVKLDAQNQEKANEINAISNEMNVIKGELDTKEKEINELKENIRTLEKEESKLSTKVEIINKENELYKRIVLDKDKQIDEYKEEISVYKINNISLEKDLKSKEEEIQTLRKELDDLNKFNTKNLDNKK